MEKQETKFMTQGDKVIPTKIPKGLLADSIEPMVYTVKYNQMMGYYLQIKTNLFELPEKLYGTVDERSSRIINTYDTRPKSTGAMFVGDKGAGKSLLSKVTCNKAIKKLGLPVLVIEDPHHGAEFNAFLELIGNAVIFFDEFAKMYDRINDNDSNSDPQDSLLSLMDGHVQGKFLFIITENEEHRINEFMKNRPGRLYYKYTYNKLELSAVREYCEDMNIDKEVIEDVVKHAESVYQFSFDMLSAIVEEHLTYGEPIDEITNILNVTTPLHKSKTTLKIVKVLNTETKKEVTADITELQNYTIKRSFAIGMLNTDDSGNNEHDCTIDREVFHIQHVRKNDGENIVYDNGNYILIAKLETEDSLDYSDLVA